MKERFIYGALIILLLGALVGTYIFQNMKHKNETTTTTEETVKEFTFLPNLDENSFKTKIDNGESFAVLIWRPDCGDSQLFIKEFKHLFVDYDNEGNVERIKYGLDQKNFYSFDISTIIPKIKDRPSRDHFNSLYGFYFTPSLVYYEDTNGDNISDVKDIAEWDATYGFPMTDYMEWFYVHDLVIPNDEVYHGGASDR